MSDTEIRIGDKIIVADGINPLRFVFAEDPQKLIYQCDDDGNALFTGETLSGENI